MIILMLKFTECEIWKCWDGKAPVQRPLMQQFSDELKLPADTRSKQSFRDQRNSRFHGCDIFHEIGSQHFSLLFPNCRHQLLNCSFMLLVCHMRSSFIFNCLLYIVLDKNPETLHADTLVLYTDRTSEKRLVLKKPLWKLAFSCVN